VASEETGNNSRKAQSDRTIDRLIAELADRQHGVVATWQLVAMGLTHDDIRYRARIGRLHRIHRGVYAVGYRTLTPKGHRMAAVLAHGPDAVLSHRSAAAHWEIGPGSWKFDVTTPHSKRNRKGMRTHTALLDPDEMTFRDGIPVTSVARTILDLAAVLRHDALTRLVENADRRELFDLKALDRVIARRPRAAGIARLRAVLAAYRGTADTRSGLERSFRALIARAGLPEPQYNVLVAGLTVDVYWPEWRLVVELDGRPYHSSPRALESDRLRDATLQKHDLRVLRVTDQRFTDDPDGVLADIIALRRM
jgi:predicted transcriptional regulator of viral defense system